MATEFNRQYAVPYTSESKGTSMDINSPQMNDFHLCAAVQKAKRKLVEQGIAQHDVDVFEALCRECGYRDLNPAYKGGRAPDDPRSSVPAGGDDMDARFEPEHHPEDEGVA